MFAPGRIENSPAPSKEKNQSPFPRLQPRGSHDPPDANHFDEEATRSCHPHLEILGQLA
jgi:hypothetical protein